MIILSKALKADRKNAAGQKKLAVFFLCCLFGFCGCSENAEDSQSIEYPFVKNQKLYSFSVDSNVKEIADSYNEKTYEFLGGNGVFSQKGVCSSLKDGWILAWNQKSGELYHIDGNKKIRSKVNLNANSVFAGKRFVLSQSNTFEKEKGFGFSLYEIKYSKRNCSIKLNLLWNGYLDCFVSDCFFTDDGICVCGGTDDNKIHNVFYITRKGAVKCFSTNKNADFLRLVNTNDSVFAFRSNGAKTGADPVLYRFNIAENQNEKQSVQSVEKALKNDELLPSDFECFYGYGFSFAENLVIPASINEEVSFLIFDAKELTIKSVVSGVTGCVAVLGKNESGVFYFAQDRLKPDSYSGTSFFNGEYSVRLN